LSPGDANLIDATGLLRKPPIGRQRLIEELQQQRAVHAVMRDKNDGVVGVSSDDETQRVCTPRDQFLERLSIGKSSKGRTSKPDCKPLRLGPLDLLVTLPLPRAVVDIVQVVEDF